MFDRFTDRAKRAMYHARQESQRLGHGYLGPEHILLGLIQAGDGGAVYVLQGLGAGLGRIRSGVERLVKAGAAPGKWGQLPFTPGAKKVLEFTLEEVGTLGHNYIGTEHLLLGLIREQNSIAAQVLAEVGVELDEAREIVINPLGSMDDDGVE